MRSAFARLFLVVSLLPPVVLAQTRSQGPKRENRPAAPLRICQGVPIPDGYVIVAYETSTSCPHGAYVLKKQTAQSRFTAPQPTQPASQAAAPAAVTASRPRKVNTSLAEPDQTE